MPRVFLVATNSETLHHGLCVSASMDEIYDWLDGMLAVGMANSAKEGRPVTCHGCSHCCKEPVECSVREVKFALEMLTTEQRELVASRLPSWLAQARASGLFKVERPYVYWWRVLNLWCPFFDQGKCMVYARRPVSCRTHNATGPEECCADDNLRHKQIFAVMPEALIGAVSAIAELDGGCESDHLGLILVELMLGKRIESANRLKLKVEFVDPP